MNYEEANKLLESFQPETIPYPPELLNRTRRKFIARLRALRAVRTLKNSHPSLQRGTAHSRVNGEHPERRR